MFTKLKNAFVTLIGICMVLTIIGAAIRGGFIGYGIADSMDEFYVLLTIVGIVAGFIVGSIVSVITFGFISLIINISNRMDQIASRLDAISVSVTNNSPRKTVFVKNAFVNIISVLMILTIIGAGIRGGFIGYGIAREMYDYYFLLSFVGVLIGLIVGTITAILAFGFISLIINISNKMDQVATTLDSLQIDVDALKAGNTTPASVDNGWVCIHCGTTNLHEYKFCKNCGK